MTASAIRMAAKAGRDIDHLASSILSPYQREKYLNESAVARDRYWARCRQAAARHQRSKEDPAAALAKRDRECVLAYQKYLKECAEAMIRVRESNS